MKFAHVPFVVLAVTVPLGACGGSSGSDLIAPTPSDAGGDATVDSNNPTDAGSTPDSKPSSDGGTNPADAAPGGDTTHLACGATSCTLPGEVCCVTRTNNSTSYACATGPCPTTGGGGNGSTASLACSDTANCASGEVCCVRMNNNTTASQCKPTCTNNEAQLCDPTPGAVTGCLATNGGSPRPCSSQNIGEWGLPPSYATCGGVGN